jgi:hypothetical protein
MRIAKMVMQIHANYVLIIDSKKNQIFLMGGAGVTHVLKSRSIYFQVITQDSNGWKQKSDTNLIKKKSSSIAILRIP